jgi:hypothetical protein
MEMMIIDKNNSTGASLERIVVISELSRCTELKYFFDKPGLQAPCN